MKSPSSRFFASPLIIRWILFSTLGLLTGIGAGLAVADPIEALVGMMLVTPVVLFAAGSVFAASQWLAIWRWHRAGLFWIGATAIALGTGMTSGIVIVETAGQAITGEPMRLFSADVLVRTIGLLVIGTLTGLAVGLSQWIVMRRYLGPRWIVLTTLGFMTGFPGGALATELLPNGLASPPGFVLFLSVTGLVVGVMTARSAQFIAKGMAGAESG
jgi:hypothetical protein